MYFGFLHYITITVFITIFALGMVLVRYKYGTGKEFKVFGLINILITGILCFSTIMMIESTFKSAEIRNITTTRVLRTESLYVSGYVFNTGKMPLKTCDVTMRLINLAPKKVGGEVFDFGRGFDFFNFKEKKQNNVSNVHTFDVNLEPGQLRKISFSVKFPPHFDKYKTTAKIKCQ